MKKKRVYELARELGLESRALVEKIKDMDISISNYQSVLSESQYKSIKEKLSAKKEPSAPKQTVVIRRRKKTSEETAAQDLSEDPQSLAEKQEESKEQDKQTASIRSDGSKTEPEAQPLTDKTRTTHPQDTQRASTTTNKADTFTADTLKATEPKKKDTSQESKTLQEADSKEHFSKVAQTLAKKRSTVVTTKTPQPETSARIIKKSSQDPAASKAKAQNMETTLPDKPSEDSKRIGARDKRPPSESEEDTLKPRGIQKKERRANYNARLLLSNIDEDEPFPVAPTRKKTVYSPVGSKSRDYKRRRDMKKTQITTPKASLRVIQMSDTTMSVGELARQLSIKAAELIKHLMKEGIMATVNQHLDSDSIEILASNFGFEVKATYKTVDEILSRRKPKDDTYYVRPPIVTLMGHVDHGKTSILDAIRSSAVSEDESGGITQHIGAYSVDHDGKSITFLDTPGHAAFSNIRLRGAKVTDIVVLVVAADDGVMPQTDEAISHAKDAEVSVIVALSKIDKPGQNLDRIYSELAEKGVQSEEWGGDHQFVKVSALKKTGLDDLLEAILLQAELMELKVSQDTEARGVIIESHLDKGRGPIATIMVSEGAFQVGDVIVAGASSGRIRSMVNDQGKKMKKAIPSMPVEIVGFNELPMVGDIVDAVKDHETAKSVVSRRKDEQGKGQQGSSVLSSLEELIAKVESDKILAVPLILKADTQGSMQAICEALADIKSEKVKAKIVHKGVGGINASDIALAQTSGSVIFGFNVRTTSNSLETTENSGVVIKYFSIIYDLIDTARSLMIGTLPPIQNEVVIGHADVRKPINVPKVGLVAGSSVLDGKITRHCMLRLIRDDVVIYTGKVGSLRRFKDDVKEVGSGYECGISFENYNDIREGDILEAFEIEELQATL